MINSTLALKADRESFSTVDLMEFNMETGVCEFLKIGSAQSFVKTKDNITEISSKALPVGILENIEVETYQMELRQGDVILMVSDGIGEAGEGVLKNEWIKKMLSLEKRTDEDILHIILEGAKNRSRVNDDMTGIIIRIKKMKGDAV
jgi:stage II sporulation protein E